MLPNDPANPNRSLPSLVTPQGFTVLALEPNVQSASLLKASVLRNTWEDRVKVMQAATPKDSEGQLADAF